MKIQPGCIVELQYELRDSDGAVVETSDEGGPLTYLHGNDEIPGGLEQKLEGVDVGAELEITLGPGEAYGDYNPDGLVTVPRDQFPPDAEIVPDDWIEVTIASEEGPAAESKTMEMRVMEISPESIVLDANHPLAGQAVTFDLKVVSVRTASAEEIEEHQKEEAEEDEESA